MSSTTITSQTYTPAQPRAVGQALRELSTAAGRVVVALSAALRPSRAFDERLTPADEAARVRELASTYVKTDPGFAADLFAAADRYEREHAH